MKFKEYILGLCATLSMGFAASSYADIVVQSDRVLNDADLCDQVVGLWTGQGDVSLGLTCHYKGSVNIKKTNDDSLQMDVVLDKLSGSFLCPEHEELPLSGTCSHSTIIIHNEKADLTGNLKEGGHAAKVVGKIKYGILPLHTDIDLKK